MADCIAGDFLLRTEGPADGVLEITLNRPPPVRAITPPFG